MTRVGLPASQFLKGYTLAATKTDLTHRHRLFGNLICSDVSVTKFSPSTFSKSILIDPKKQQKFVKKDSSFEFRKPFFNGFLFALQVANFYFETFFLLSPSPSSLPFCLSLSFSPFFHPSSFSFVKKLLKIGCFSCQMC